MVELALSQEPSERARSIEIKGVNGFVFNITAPFQYKEETLIAGRIQTSKDNTSASTIGFFRQTDDSSFELRNIIPAIGLEDPSVTSIYGNSIFGYVQTHRSGGEVGYKTVFYKNPDLDRLGPQQEQEQEPLVVGPERMKDIRLVELQDGRIGVFTRPQGGKITKKGKIGFTIIKTLDDLDENVISSAPLIPDQFDDSSWGGVNAAYLLKDGKIGVLGHVASVDSKGKHYKAMMFAFDPNTRTTSPMEIIATREDFPEDFSENDELKDIVFPGGVVINDNNPTKAFLYGGVSDEYAGIIEFTLPDWFKM